MVFSVNMFLTEMCIKCQTDFQAKHVDARFMLVMRVYWHQKEIQTQLSKSCFLYHNRGQLRFTANILKTDKDA